MNARLFRFYCPDCKAHFEHGLAVDGVRVFCEAGHDCGVWGDGGDETKICHVCNIVGVRVVKSFPVRVRYDRVLPTGAEIRLSEGADAWADHFAACHEEVMKRAADAIFGKDRP